jgi:histidyl-tRNA synthetase
MGRDKVIEELVLRLGLSDAVADAILTFTTNPSPTRELLGQLSDAPMMDNPLFAQGLRELQEVVDGVRSLGVPDESFKVDLSIARGLGYYTGTVYETTLLAHPDLGSICSGGRYDDLASYFTNEKLPGVGISIGLSRLAFALLERGVLKTDAATPAKVLVTSLDAAQTPHYLHMAAVLRERGIATEVYLEKKSLGDQLKYASKKGFKVALIAGESEFANGTVKVKNLATGEELVVGRDAFVETLFSLLS